MALRVLWPAARWRDDRHIEIESLGPGVEAVFGEGFQSVTQAQWAECDGIVSTGDPSRFVDVDSLARCRILVTPKVGFDNIDLEKWGKAGIPVCNVPDYGTQEVADHAIALMLTFMKSIHFHTERLRDDPRGNWRPALNPFGRRLSACTFGVVGLGRIGTAAALRAKAFNMNVVFFDPYLPNGMDLALGVRRADTLQGLFSESDVVSLHVPLSAETTRMIDASVLAAAKPGLILINTARGEVIDLDALHDALKQEKLGAAGLDVLPEEPANPDAPLIRAFSSGEAWIKHRLLLTPHSAFFTPESARDMRAKAGEVAARYLRDRQLDNCVNAPWLTHRR
jgi:lactate dehydrogenase-like 2-hydroxyacid dehydrogenase